VKVKICGITNIADALMCQNFGADALGFIFYKKSKRFISPYNAAKIIEELSPFVLKVGVFVDESEEEVNKVGKSVGLNAVQLYCQSDDLNTEKIHLPVIKAYRVTENFDFKLLQKQDKVFFLLDSFSKYLYGGTGKKFDWTIIPEKIKAKVILAGGVSIDNLDEIFYKVKPAAIDLSSSLEFEPGKKDRTKVKMFFKKLNEFKGSLC
jgi:phosphoribosylanthranilate isomerase